MRGSFFFFPSFHQHKSATDSPESHWPGRQLWAAGNGSNEDTAQTRARLQPAESQKQSPAETAVCNFWHLKMPMPQHLCTQLALSLPRGVAAVYDRNAANSIRQWNLFEINWWVMNPTEFMILELGVIPRYNVNSKVAAADERTLLWSKQNPFFFGWRHRQHQTISQVTSALSLEWI